MPYCEQCGKEYNTGNVFCESCGVKLSVFQSQSPKFIHKKNLKWFLALGACICIILLMTLITYDPNDLPFFTSHPNYPSKNIFGHWGAYLGWFLTHPYLPKQEILQIKKIQPVAQVKIGNQTIYIDKNRIPRQNNNFSGNNIPEIVIPEDEMAGLQAGNVCNSEQLRLALSLLGKINARENFKGKVTAIDATSKYDKLSFVMDNGIKIIIGKKDFAEKLKALEILFTGKRINPEQIEYIDLRFKDVVVKEKSKP